MNLDLGTRVRLLPSYANEELAQAVGFDPTGRLGTIVKVFLYYFVKLDDKMPPIPGIPDNLLCVLPEELEVVE